MKKKILFVVEAMSGGVRKHIVQLIENLDQTKFELFLIHGTKNIDKSFKHYYDKLKINCKMFPCESLVREISPNDDLKSYKFIVDIIRLIRPDVVHCHSSKAGGVGRISAKRCNVEQIFYTPHAYSFMSIEFGNFKKKLYVFIERILSSFFTTKSFCVSKEELLISRKYKVTNKKNSIVIYNGLSEIKFPSKEEIRCKLGLPINAIIIGNCSRMTLQKNPRLFLKIAMSVINEDENIHFVWIGSGEEKEKIEIFVKANNLTNNIHIYEEREDSEIIVAAFDIFLFTSIFEGLPYSLIESIRATVPILATDIVGNREVVQSGLNGYLFPLDTTISRSDFKKQYIDKVLEISNANIYKSFDSRFLLNDMIIKISKEYFL